MKLSENTLTVLKNFAAINSGIVFQEGNVQKTISPENSILVEAELEDQIPNQFGVYDLNQFLGNITTLGSPELSFSKESVTMSDGEINLRYFSASPSVIITPPADKQIVVKSVDVSFTLPNAILQKLLRLAAMNDLPNLSVIGKNGEIRIQAHEKSNDTSNSASFKVADYTGEDFEKVWKVDNLKLIPDEYTVDIVLTGFARFTSKNKKIKYFIAFETKTK